MFGQFRKWLYEREQRKLEEERRQRAAIAEEMIQQWRQAEWKRRQFNGEVSRG